MTEPTHFATLLKRYRQAAGLSQEALAARAQLSARAISDLERGINRAPRHDTLELLIEALPLSSHQRALFKVAARPESLASSVDASSLLLPNPPTSLIGREQDLMRALACIRRDHTRLLTVTGPSGVGKTRFALQVAQELSGAFADALALVTLASVRDATLVPGSIAQALSLREQGETPLTTQIRAYLQSRHFLLVLDNFEQVLEAAAFVADLLASCPRLTVLVTSRTPLHLRGEQELPLGPLALDDAISLFCERAQALRPGGTYATPLVKAICERVDRLPLAIELAAVQVKVFSLPQLLERLTNRLALLRGGADDLPARQQTMEDAIAWSYELLTETQQRCFRALSVFVGGWTLEAAEAVCWGGQEIVERSAILTFATLVDASLVQTEMAVDGITRFTMLEMIREYALDRLRTAGEEAVYRDRHAAYYAHVAQTVVLFGPGQGTRDAHLTKELPNARAALQWVEQKQDAELGLRLALYSRLWYMSGQVSEAEMWIERMLSLDRQAREHAGPSALRVELLFLFGQSLLSRGKLEQTVEIANEALRLAQQMDNHSGMSNAFDLLGQVAFKRGKSDEATSYFTACANHASLSGNIASKSRALMNLAESARLQGDFANATTHLEEALAIAQDVGMIWGMANVMTMLGHIAQEQKHYPLAKARYREGLTLYRTLSSTTYTAWCLEGLAATLCAEGQYAQAMRLCAAAAAMREQVQTPLPPAERGAFEHTVARAKAALSESAFEEEWIIGSELTHDEAIDCALSEACT